MRIIEIPLNNPRVNLFQDGTDCMCRLHRYPGVFPDYMCRLYRYPGIFPDCMCRLHRYPGVFPDCMCTLHRYSGIFPDYMCKLYRYSGKVVLPAQTQFILYIAYPNSDYYGKDSAPKFWESHCSHTLSSYWNE